MKKMLENSLKIIAMSLLLFMLVGCYNANKANVRAAGQTKNQLSVWTVYWDLEEGAKEFQKFEKHLDEACAF